MSNCDHHAGCRECTKRRIICDSSEPSCNKCLKKGIQCSGFGRIRFSGVAQRGKLRDGFGPQPQTSNVTPSSIRWKHDQQERIKQSRKNRNPSVDRLEPRQASKAGLAMDHVGLAVSDNNKSTDCTLMALCESVPYWIAPMGHRSRMSMSHCKIPIFSFHIVSSRLTSLPSCRARCTGDGGSGSRCQWLSRYNPTSRLRK